MLLKIYLSNYYYCKPTHQAKCQGCYKILFSYMKKIPRHTFHELRPLEHERNVLSLIYRDIYRHYLEALTSERL